MGVPGLPSVRSRRRSMSGSGWWTAVHPLSCRAPGSTGVGTFFRSCGLRWVSVAGGPHCPFSMHHKRGIIGCLRGPLSSSLRVSSSPCCPDSTYLRLRLAGDLWAGCLPRSVRRFRGGRRRCPGVGAWVPSRRPLERQISKTRRYTNVVCCPNMLNAIVSPRTRGPWRGTLPPTLSIVSDPSTPQAKLLASLR